MNDVNVKLIEIYELYLLMQKRSLQMQLNEIGRQLDKLKELKGKLPPTKNTYPADSVK